MTAVRVMCIACFAILLGSFVTGKVIVDPDGNQIYLDDMRLHVDDNGTLILDGDMYVENLALNGTQFSVNGSNDAIAATFVAHDVLQARAAPRATPGVFLNASFTSGGGEMLCYGQGSGMMTSVNVFYMRILFNGAQVSLVQAFCNQLNHHRTFGFSFVATPAAGVVAVSFEMTAATGKVDVKDEYVMTCLEKVV